MVDVFTGRVAVIGLGYLGLPTAVVLAPRGLEVIGGATDPRTIAAIEPGEAPLPQRRRARASPHPQPAQPDHRRTGPSNDPAERQLHHY